MRALEKDRRRAIAREKADAINEFLLTVLISSDPNQGGRQKMQVSEAMRNAVGLLDEGAFTDQPEVEHQLRLTIAKIFTGNAQGAEALPNAEKAIAIARRLPGGGQRELAQAWFAASQPRGSTSRSSDGSSSVAAATLWSLVVRTMVVDPQKGLSLAKELHRRALNTFPPGSEQLAHEHSLYGSALVQAKTAESAVLAEPILREAIRVRQRTADPRMAIDQAALGGAILGQIEGRTTQTVSKGEYLARLREAEESLSAGLEALANEKVKLSPLQRADLRSTAADSLMRLNRVWNELEPDAGRDARVKFFAFETARLRSPTAQAD